MAKKLIEQPRDFPAVEEFLQSEELVEHIRSVPRPIAVEIIRQEVSKSKQSLIEQQKPISLNRLHGKIINALNGIKNREITRIINASGVLVHTNLGRAPLTPELFDSIKPVVTGYGNIEFDLKTGSRGKRGLACEQYLTILSEAEAGTVVNNCAAALFLILNTLTNRKEVVVSRGELVQIGGGFRIPDILKRSGAKLVEVGTTNITTAGDYEGAINARTGLLLKVHKSNFTQTGFTEEPPLAEIVAVGAKHDIPVLNDLGSGAFVSVRELLDRDEPTVQQSVRAGAALTCFSGDKMLGGSQAGLIVGHEKLIKRIKKNPLFRTMRVDKITLAILERLLSIYLRGEHADYISLWRLLHVPESELYQRGKEILKKLDSPTGVSVESTQACIGGGAAPQAEIPSVGIIFSQQFNPTELMRRFRQHRPPIVGRIEDDRLVLDHRAIAPADLPTLTDVIADVLKQAKRTKQ